jgi:serine protease Do
VRPALRVVTLVVVVAAVIGGLLATGLISIRVDVHPPGRASAEFWTASEAKGPLAPDLARWVILAKDARPAVVNVSAAQGGLAGDEFFRRFFEGHATPRRASLGSGFLVSGDGYVVTNNHVVQGGRDIIVKLGQGGEHRARVVGVDPEIDLALLKIEAGSTPLLPLGDSDQLEVGEPVMAIGNPFGLDQTVTTGIVSAKERFIGTGRYDDFIQTDASVNPGNSGGPLVDSRGAVVGITTAIFSRSGGSIGIGFAIPINLAKAVLPQLRTTGRVVRGWLGVALRPAVEASASAGVAVDEVVPRSPAERAGIRRGDVILAVDGQTVSRPAELIRRVASLPPGREVTLLVLRDRAERSFRVELGQQPARAAPPG